MVHQWFHINKFVGVPPESCLYLSKSKEELREALRVMGIEDDGPKFTSTSQLFEICYIATARKLEHGYNVFGPKPIAFCGYSGAVVVSFWEVE